MEKDKKFNYRLFILVFVFLALAVQLAINPKLQTPMWRIELNLANKAQKYEMYDIANFFLKRAKKHRDSLHFVDFNIGLNLYNKAKDIKVPTKRQISLKKLEMKQSEIPEFMQTSKVRAIAFMEHEYNRKNQLLREAIEYFDKELQVNPQMTNSLNYIAEAYKLLQEPENAVKYFEKSLEIKPDDTYVLYNIAETYADMYNENEKALKYTNKYLQLKPNTFDMYFTKGWILNNMKRYDEALEAYKIYASEYPNSYSVYLNMTNICMRKNDYKNAEIYLEKGLNLNKYDEDLLTDKAEILAYKGNYIEANTIAQELLEKDENHGYIVYPVLGAIDLVQGNKSGAEENFQKAYENAKFYYDIYCTSGVYEPNDYEAECYNRKILIENFENIKKDYYKKFYKPAR